VDVDHLARVVEAMAHDALEPRLRIRDRTDGVKANVLRHGIRQRKTQQLRRSHVGERAEWREHRESGTAASDERFVGDVALLRATETRFLVGLGAFLLAHVAYIWAILETPGVDGFPWPLVAAVPALVLLHAKVGRDIVRHAGAQRVPVFVYQLVISALVLVAAWKGDWLLLAGCAVFVASDAVLGHDRFVHERRWAPLTVIVTYHVAQVLIVVALFR